MEESGRPMRRYGVAAHERVADGRRSVRRRGEETATGGHGWRVRTSSALCSSSSLVVVRTADGQASETSFGGQRGLLHTRCARADGGNTTLQRMGAAAGNLRSASRGSAGAQTAICLNRPSTKGSAHDRVQDSREIAFVPDCEQASCAVLSRPCCFIRTPGKQHAHTAALTVW
jgi:hypothetical protein